MCAYLHIEINGGRLNQVVSCSVKRIKSLVTLTAMR